MKILITGGPVHAYLDPVKIITNKFKGGLMAELDKE
jgi:phosphopantothenoylcysteine synthetase/decarboxylase